VGGNRWGRALLAGLLALALLLLALYALDQAGGYVDSSDVWGAFAVSLIAGAVAA
jgi:hypothetical protein